MSAKIVLAMMLALTSCASSEAPADLESAQAENARPGAWTQQWTPPEGGWASVSAGYGHVVAIRADGSLWAWGWNLFGQLGDGTRTTRHAPVRIGSDYDWAMVSAGGRNTAAIRTDGTLWAWGQNNTMQLGDGTRYTRFAPSQVGTATDWAYVSIDVEAGGWLHGRTAAIKTDGSLWSWGSNAWGQIGDGTSGGFVGVPTRVGACYDWVRVSVSSRRTFAIRLDGSLWAWGSNANGFLGIGQTPPINFFMNYQSTPARVGADYGWAFLANGGHSVAIKADGTLWAWGSNMFHQLGDGTTTDRAFPGQLGTEADWVSAARGSWHAVALKRDGSLWAWGSNNFGQLGDGAGGGGWAYNATHFSSVPARMETPTRFVRVAAGAMFTLAIGEDGALWAWGRNHHGQLGDGTTENSLVPALVAAPE